MSVAVICSIAFGYTALAIVMLLFTGNRADSRDFVSYWAAGHQIASHQNPYSSEDVLRIERSVGFPAGVREIIMRNPPSALALVLPLCLFGLKAGSLLWSLLLLACLALSVRLLWIIHGRPHSLLNLLGYSFAPALSCVLTGQTSLFVLLGLVLFLRFHQTRPLLAGISLWLCALKPHLFVPFGLVLLVWVVITKSYPILVGAAAALAASSAVAFLFDQHAWSQYSSMMRTWGVDREYHPCLSVVLRFAIKPDAMWLQNLPVVVGCGWALVYFWKRRETWNWATHGSLLLLVSLLTAPYAWFTDEAVLIPAILCGAYLTRSRGLIALLALASTVIEAEFFFRIPVNSRLFFWTAPVWLLWYLCATRTNHATEVYDSPPSANDTTGLVEHA
jgi:hypothetical protein